jgi:uncharacterized protein YceH (UPF0502 family)
MSKRKLRLDRRLYNLLANRGPGCFTVVQLRDEYVRGLPDDTYADPSTIRAHISNQLSRMRRRRLVRCELGSRARGWDWRVVADLAPYADELVSGPYDTFLSDSEDSESESELDLSNLLAAVRRQAEGYLRELMKSQSEEEEYTRLFTKFPPLKSLLEPHYQRTNNRVIELEGRIEAVKSIVLELQSRGA